MEYRMHPSGSLTIKPRYVTPHALLTEDPRKMLITAFNNYELGVVPEKDVFRIMRWLADCQYQFRSSRSPCLHDKYSSSVTLELSSPLDENGKSETILFSERIILPKGDNKERRSDNELKVEVMRERLTEKAASELFQLALRMDTK